MLCEGTCDLHPDLDSTQPTCALPSFHPALRVPQAFKALATKLKLSTATMTSSMTKKSALMKQIM